MGNPVEIERIMRGGLEGCARGNGDGLGTWSSEHGREAFCLCNVCRASRFRRREVAQGRLTEEQGAAIDALVAHLREPATVEGPILLTSATDPDDDEHEVDFS